MRSMRRCLMRVLIFGLLGPAGTSWSLYWAGSTAARFWWPQPSIYLVEMIPFLLCAFADGAMKDIRAWERLVLTAFVALIASSLACAVAYGGPAAAALGLFSPVAAAACSVLATATDVPDQTPIDDP